MNTPRQQKWILIFLLALLALAAAPPARAQVIVIDRRPEFPIARSYEMREVSVSGTIRDQVAEIQVLSTLHNPGARPLEAEFLFPIPADGAVQSMTLLVDGKELPGRILSRDEARGVYEEIVRIKRDPALMEYIGQGLYRTRVFPIPAGADRQLSIRYTQLCPMDGNVVNFSYLMTAQKLAARPIGTFRLNLRIVSRTPVKSIYSPTHDDLKVERAGDGEARVTLEERNVTPEGDFRLLYALDKSKLGLTVLSTRPDKTKDGYFLLLASPELKKPDAKPQPKTVLFVLDHSGSMTGEKIEQARNSLRFVLNNLKEGDTFNIITYNDMVEPWKETPQPYNKETRADAERFVNSIEASGSTNINEALQMAMKMTGGDAERPSYVLFLTDGLPTTGERNELKISENCKAANKAGARIFAFGVGYDANARLLDRLSGGNGGASEYVRPSEDIEAKVSRFYSRLTSPVLSGIKITASHGDPGQIYPVNIPDLFEGGQLVLAGRYREPGDTVLRLSGKSGGQEVTYEYPVRLADAEGGSATNSIERLWAMRRIGWLIDQVDLNGQNQELTDELTRLSTKYGILTPYTAYLADERVQLDAAGNRVQTESLLKENLSDASGANAQAQRDFKNKMMFGGSASMAAPKKLSQVRPDAFAGGRGRLFEGGAPGAKVNAPVPAAASPARQMENNVRQLGSKTFFLKEGVWVESELKPEDVKQATVIEQFSEPYFKLSRQLKAADNQYLAFSEPVVVRLEGKIYRINQQAKH